MCTPARVPAEERPGRQRPLTNTSCWRVEGVAEVERVQHREAGTRPWPAAGGTRCARSRPRSCGASPPGASWGSRAPREVPHARGPQPPDHSGSVGGRPARKDSNSSRQRTTSAGNVGAWAAVVIASPPAPPATRSPLLEFEREFLAAGLHDAAVQQDVHEVGHDVVEQPLVVGDDDHRPLRRAQLR